MKMANKMYYSIPFKQPFYDNPDSGFLPGNNPFVKSATTMLNIFSFLVVESQYPWFINPA